MFEKLLGISMILLFLISCGSEQPALEIKISSPDVLSKDVFNESAAPGLRKDDTQQVHVNFKGVSFSYDERLLGQAFPSEQESIALRDRTDKPDYVRPKQIKFDFVGNYADRHSSSTFLPQLIIFSVDAYREIFVIDDDYVSLLDKDINTLSRVLVEAPQEIKTEFPVLPWIDSMQVFRSRPTFVNFRNGRGVFYLTQFSPDPSLINNSGLTYLFQGITKDKKYLVFASFPVRAAFLPNNFEVKRFEGYSVPNYFFDKKSVARNTKEFERYVSKMTERLGKLRTDEFNPDLRIFEDLVKSIFIEALE